MSEGAPLRAATVASMAAEQQAHAVEQLRARLADLTQGKSDRRFAYLMRAVGEDLATGMSPALAVAARTAGMAQQHEWAVRVGNALLGQLSTPADHSLQGVDDSERSHQLIRSLAEYLESCGGTRDMVDG